MCPYPYHSVFLGGERQISDEKKDAFCNAPHFLYSWVSSLSTFQHPQVPIGRHCEVAGSQLTTGSVCKSQEVIHPHQWQGRRLKGNDKESACTFATQGHKHMPPRIKKIKEHTSNQYRTLEMSALTECKTFGECVASPKSQRSVHLSLKVDLPLYRRTSGSLESMETKKRPMEAT